MIHSVSAGETDMSREHSAVGGHRALDGPTSIWVSLLVFGLLAEPLVLVSTFDDAFVLPKLATIQAIFLVGWIANVFLCLRRRTGLPHPPAPLLVGASLFAFANVLSLALSADPRMSMLGEYLSYQGFTTVLLYLGYLLVVAGLPLRERTANLLLAAMLAAASLSAFYAVLQVFNVDWLDWTGSDVRPFASFGQPDTLGIYLAQVLPFGALALALWRGAARAFLALAIGLMLAALVLTLSRSAWLGLGVAGVTATALLGRPALERMQRVPLKAALTAMVVPALLASLLVPAAMLSTTAVTQVRQRLTSSLDFGSVSVGSRLALWQQGLEMMADRPIWGWGPETFGVQFPRYRDPEDPHVGTANTRPISSHNAFVDLGLTTGALGLVTFLALLLLCYRPIVRTASDGPWGWRRAFAVAIASSSAGYLAAVCFNFWEVTTAWHFWVLTGVGVAISSSAEDAPDPGGGWPPRWRLSGGWHTALLVAIMGAAAAVLLLAAYPVAAEHNASRARAATNRGDWPAATRLYQEAVNLNPLQREYLLLLGDALSSRAFAEPERTPELLQESVDAFHAASKRFADDAFVELSAAWNEAIMAVDYGLPADHVSQHLEKASALDPYNQPFRCIIAQVYQYLGDAASASRHLMVAQQLGQCP
jgi:O-antigen ligase